MRSAIGRGSRPRPVRSSAGFADEAHAGAARHPVGSDHVPASCLEAGVSPVALICPRCGAPLPEAVRRGAGSCAYCGAEVMLRGASLALGSRTVACDVEEAERRRRAFHAAVKSASLSGTDPYRVLCEAARAHLGLVGESDTLARVVLALAEDFEAETGASVRSDPQVLSRLADAYLRASGELAHHPRTTLNLPFLAATASGPVHLLREIGVAELVALASREPGAVVAAPKAAPAPPPEPPKKRGWWPF